MYELVPEYIDMDTVIANRKKELYRRNKKRLDDWVECNPWSTNGTRTRIWWQILRQSMDEIETLNEYRWGDPANLEKVYR